MFQATFVITLSQEYIRIYYIFSTSPSTRICLRVPTWSTRTIRKSLLADPGMIVLLRSIICMSNGVKSIDSWIQMLDIRLACFGLLVLFFFHIYTFCFCSCMPSLGIPHSSRARSVLFSQGALQPKTTAYPSIGQKKLNGAASRIMVFFAVWLSTLIARDHPCDFHRWGVLF